MQTSTMHLTWDPAKLPDYGSQIFVNVITDATKTAGQADAAAGELEFSLPANVCYVLEIYQAQPGAARSARTKVGTIEMVAGSVLPPNQNTAPFWISKAHTS